MTDDQKTEALLAGLTDILEADARVTPATELAAVGQWDSLAVVCTIALLDEHAGVQVEGKALAGCQTAGDVLKLAGLEC